VFKVAGQQSLFNINLGDKQPTIGEGFSALGTGIKKGIDTASEGFNIIYGKVVKDTSKIYIPTTTKTPFGIPNPITGFKEVDLKETKKKAIKELGTTTEKISERVTGFDTRSQELFLTKYLPKNGMFVEKDTGQMFSFPSAQKRFEDTKGYKELSKQAGAEFYLQATPSEEIKLAALKGYSTYAPEQGGELFYKGALTVGISALTLGKGLPLLTGAYSALPSGIRTAWGVSILGSSYLTVTNPYRPITEKIPAVVFGTLAGIDIGAKAYKAGLGLYSKATSVKAAWIQKPIKKFKILKKLKTPKFMKESKLFKRVSSKLESRRFRKLTLKGLKKRKPIEFKTIQSKQEQFRQLYS